MNKKIGFIGLGKMATAIFSGIMESTFANDIEAFGYEVNPDAAKKLQEKYPISICGKAEELVQICDIIFLCVKPFVIKDVLAQIKSAVSEKKVIVSIAAGISIKTIADIIGENANIIRIMPNTPALVKSGMSGLAASPKVAAEDVKYVINLLKSVSKVVEFDEKLLDAVTALSGSGPAFYYYLINQFALSATKEGLNYKDALLLSAQTALGSAKMIMETGEDPAILIKNVTTPGGTTEVGNNILNASDIAQVFDEVIAKTAQKSRDLGK